jgi:phosphatidylglycerol:prolipoprotein diacylglycerol transferase
LHPVLFQIGKLKIYSYGFMLALAFFVGIWLASKRAPKYGVKEENIFDLSIILIVAAVVGSRGLYILTHRSNYHSILDIIALWQGGATYYGGLIMAVAGAIIYLRYKDISFFKVADICSPPIALGVFITRIGCFLSGCCFGLPTECSFGLVFPPTSPAGHTFSGIHIHPTQLYSSLYGLVIFAVLLLLERRRSFDGYTFGFLCMLYGTARFIVDFFRYYESCDKLGGVLTLSQLLSLVLVVTGVVLVVYLPRKRVKAKGDRRPAE